MAHALTTRKDGTAEMFFVASEGTPWHRMGTGVTQALTSSEALVQSGQDWDVLTLPTYHQYRQTDGAVGMREIPKYRALVRKDTGVTFGIATEAYTPLQNRDAFRFADSLVAAGGAVFTTGGTLFGGKRTWMQLTLPGDLAVSRKDTLSRKILLTNSHDGSHAFQVKLCLQRVVCWNTLSFALGEQGGSYKARHTRGILDKVTDAREALGLAEAYFAMMMRGIERLAATEISRQEALSVFGQVYELDPNKVYADQSAHKRFAIDQTMALFRTGRGNSGETRWDALNAVTEYLDHIRPVGALATAGRKGDTQVSKRLEHSWYGAGEQVRQRAWDTLTEIGPLDVDLYRVSN